MKHVDLKLLEGVMRSVVAITSAMSIILAQVPTTGFAQSAAPLAQPVALTSPAEAQTSEAEAQNAAIEKAFKAFPNGGDGLVKRISNMVVRNPKLATDVLKYVKTAPGVTYGQKTAAEHGLAAALERMGINAADMAVKAPPPAQAVEDYTWLAALAAALVVGGIVCIAVCNHHHEQISPN
jgi:hypothetical protein